MGSLLPTNTWKYLPRLIKNRPWTLTNRSRGAHYIVGGGVEDVLGGVVVHHEGVVMGGATNHRDTLSWWGIGPKIRGSTPSSGRVDGSVFFLRKKRCIHWLVDHPLASYRGTLSGHQ
jgi:hypothetical protein